MKRDVWVFFVSLLLIFGMGIFFVGGDAPGGGSDQGTGAMPRLRDTFLTMGPTVLITFAVSVVLALCAMLIDKRARRKAGK